MSLIERRPRQGENPLFEHVPVPVLPPSTTLADLTTHGDDHAWLAATTDVFTSRPSTPLILRWNGTTWTEDDLPALPRAASLTGISATAPDDVWAVGNTAGTPLLLHYDGTHWTHVETPPVGWAKAVAAITPDDVRIITNGPDTLRRTAGTWLIERALRSPRQGLHTITATGPDDVWAGGSGWSGTGPTSYQCPLLVHWNGHTWTDHPMPEDTSPRGHVTSLAAASPTDLWMSCATGTSTMGIHRWNGTTWTTLPHRPAPGRLTLHSVDIGWTWGTWAKPGTFETRPVHFRWTGTDWTRVALPTDLTDVSASDTGLATTPHGTTTWTYLKTADGVHILRHRT